jgi:MFS family permease
VNSLELLERGAYYALMAVLALHMYINLHFSEFTIGVVIAIFMVCLYFLPVILGAIADKVGFKQMLIFNFILMFIGYLLIGLVSATVIFLIGIIILGVGAGGFKPIISSTIANITKSKQRNLAYAIYYWMINCGAFFFPLSFGLYFTTFPSTDAAAPYFRYIFFFSAIFVIVNLVITFLFYKNPKEPETEKDIKTVFANAAVVVKDFKFFSLLIIYSGFWFMFAMNHSFLPLYMVQFKIMPGWFTPLLLATINPGTIIIVGPFLAKYMEKLPSIQMMIIGNCIFMTGLIILGTFLTPLGLFIGIIMFSVGEFLTHPNFISYVSKIAPKERLTIYMGYIFIATGIGLVLGSLFGGLLYENIARYMERPKLFWGIVISVGLVSTFFLMFYNRLYSEKKPKEGEEKGVIPIKRDILEMKFTMVLPLIFIPVILFISYSGGTNSYFAQYEEESEEFFPDWANDYNLVSVDYYTEPGYSAENSNTEISITLSQEEDIKNLESVTFTLTWQDEPDYSGRHSNQPDSFTLKINSPEGSASDSGQQNDGYASVTIEFDPQNDPYFNGTGEYQITIQCDNCGDHELWRPSGGVQDQPDNGNDWSLDVKYSYYEKTQA